MTRRIAPWGTSYTRDLPVKRAKAWAAYEYDDRVTTPDGTDAPRAFTYVEEPTDRDSPRLEVDCEHDSDGVLRIVGVYVTRQDGGRDILAADLTKLSHLEATVKQAWLAVGSRPAFGLGSTLDDATTAAEVMALAGEEAKRREWTGIRKRARAKVPDEQFRRAAEIYRTNRAGGKPTQAVMNQMGEPGSPIPESTARWYIKQAELKGMDLGGPRVSTGGVASNG